MCDLTSLREEIRELDRKRDRLRSVLHYQEYELVRRLSWHMPQVDRLFDLRHASKLDQIEAAQ